MDKTELFSLAEPLVELIKQHQKTGTLTFKDITQKQSLQRIYREIYPGVKIELACDSCVLHNLNVLLAWYEKEYPKYQKTINKPSEAVKTIPKPIVEPEAKADVLHIEPQPKQNKKNGK